MALVAFFAYCDSVLSLCSKIGAQYLMMYPLPRIISLHISPVLFVVSIFTTFCLSTFQMCIWVCLGC